MWVEPEDGPERDLVQPAARPARARAATAVSADDTVRAPDGRRSVTPPSPFRVDAPVVPMLPGTGELILIVDDEPEFRGWSSCG